MLFYPMIILFAVEILKSSQTLERKDGIVNLGHKKKKKSKPWT